MQPKKKWKRRNDNISYLKNIGSNCVLRNREFVFASKIQYKLTAERSEANRNLLQIPYWCIYTTKLEPILARISDSDERLRAAAKRRLRLKQNFLYNSFFARATNFFF
jgi:hypothetical protein